MAERHRRADGPEERVGQLSTERVSRRPEARRGEGGVTGLQRAGADLRRSDAPRDLRRTDQLSGEDTASVAGPGREEGRDGPVPREEVPGRAAPCPSTGRGDEETGRGLRLPLREPGEGIQAAT